MDMEERYRLIISTILNAIGFRVEVEKMLSTGRIDIVTTTPHFIYVIELKLSKNGGKKAGAEQILHNQYLEPFKSDKRQTIGLSIELDDLGKGLTDWEEIKDDKMKHANIVQRVKICYKTKSILEFRIAVFGCVLR